MANAKILSDIIAGHCPGCAVEVRDVGKYLVVGLHNGGQKVWIALDHQHTEITVDEALGLLANMLVCCLHCADDAHFHCKRDRRTAAARLKKLLGNEGFRMFLENAPIAAHA